MFIDKGTLRTEYVSTFQYINMTLLKVENAGPDVWNIVNSPGTLGVALG